MSGLPGLVIFTKDDALEQRGRQRQALHGESRVVVCFSSALRAAKASRTCRTSRVVFSELRGREFTPRSFSTTKAIRRRSTRTRPSAPSSDASGVAVAPSAINDIIQNTLRLAVRRHVYVSVTGTPQAVLLQSADSTHSPILHPMLPPGATRTSAAMRFSMKDEPDDNETLITLVDQNEKRQTFLDPG